MRETGSAKASEKRGEWIENPIVLFPLWQLQLSGLNSFCLRLMELLKHELGSRNHLLLAAPVPPRYAEIIGGLCERVWVAPAAKDFVTFGKAVLARLHPQLFIPTSPFDLAMARTMPPHIPLWFWCHGLTPHWQRMILAAQNFDADIFIAGREHYHQVDRDLKDYGHLHHLPFWVPTSRPPSFRPEATLKWVHCGRLDQNTKGVLDGIVLMKTLLANGCACSLDYVGDGPDRARLERAIETNGLSHRMAILGEHTPHDLSDIWGAYDGVLSFSRRESFGLAVLEAMAHGLTPVCLQPRQGNFEFLERAGFGCAPSLDAMVKRIRAYADLNPTERGEMRTKIANFTADHYGPRTARAHLQRLFHEGRIRRPRLSAWRHPGNRLRLARLHRGARRQTHRWQALHQKG